MSKRTQRFLAKAFNTTGVPTKAVPVVGSGGNYQPDSDMGSNYLAVYDVRGMDALSLYCEATGGTSAVFTVQVTNDPDGLAGWQNVAYREGGGGAYVVTAITLVPATARNLFLDPADAPTFLRVNCTANTGPTVFDVVALGNL